MAHEFSVAAHWDEAFDDRRFRLWVERLRASLRAPSVQLGLIFMAPRYFPHAAEILEILRVHGRIALLAGCSSQSLICGGEEIEANAGLCVGLYHLPGAQLHGFHFTQQQLDESSGPASWHAATGLRPDAHYAWLAFADPFGLDCDSWLRGWNEAYPGAPVLGGLASGGHGARTTQIYLNGEAHDEGVAVVAIGGNVEIAGVISQGCTPIGETWTITKASENLILEIGNRPAYHILNETFAKLPPEEQKKAQGNLFIGLVVNEYLEEFRRGDFLVRNLLGADPVSGILAVGAFPRAGQTIQFQRRDATAANEDMLALLNRAHEQFGERVIYGGCLCSCNGRGSGLFGYPNHDAGMVQRRLGPLALTGFFCNGEIGPVGNKNFLHGYTASLALFVQKRCP